MNQTILNLRRPNSVETANAISAALRKTGLRVVKSFIDEFSAFSGLSIAEPTLIYLPIANHSGADVAFFVDWTSSEGLHSALGSGGRPSVREKVGPLLTFAYGGLGDEFRVDIARGTIWVDLHEEEQPFRKVASSFSDFLSKLTVLKAEEG